MADSLAEVEVETVGNTLAEEGAKALLDTLASKKNTHQVRVQGAG